MQNEREDVVQRGDSSDPVCRVPPCHPEHSVRGKVPEEADKFDIKGFLMMGLMMTAIIVIVFIVFTDDLVLGSDKIDRFGNQLNNYRSPN